MPTVVTVKPGQLGAFIKSTVRANRAAVTQGIRAGARRGAQYLASNNGPGPVFDGLLKNSWDVLSDASTGASTVVNMAPYAGVVERGARPHPVNREGVAAIREWVRRKFIGMTTAPGGTGKPRLLTPHEATHAGGFGWYVDEITWAIVNKIKREGTQGTFFVRDSLDKLRGFVDDEINIRIAKGVSGGP